MEIIHHVSKYPMSLSKQRNKVWEWRGIGVDLIRGLLTMNKSPLTFGFPVHLVSSFLSVYWDEL